MARKAREKSSTGIYHILLRANNKLFYDDKDREYFVSLIKQYFKDGVSVYGYRIEDDRVHLVIKEGDKTISQALKPFCTSYARFFNREHNADGKLFDGRFKSEPIEDNKMLARTLGYLYRDNPDSFKKDKIIDRSEIKSVKPDKEKPYLAMDEYSSMSEKEIKAVVDFLCSGIENFKELSDAEKFAAVQNADTASRLKGTTIRKTLGIKETAKKKTEDKKAPSPKKKPAVRKKSPEKKKTKPTEKLKKPAEEAPQKPVKKELPVWLL